MHVVVAGGTGFLGGALVGRLKAEGHSVAVLTRRPRAAGQLGWDPSGVDRGWMHAVDGADVVVNLAGAPLDRRWTKAYRQEMWNSRVLATRTLVEAIGAARRAPGVLVSGSAVGYYGSRGDEPLTEASAPSSDFLSTMAGAWEQAALDVPSGVRVVVIRTGVVLARHAGALPRMAMPYRFFAGGPVGSGRQYLSWIHLYDWTAMVRWAMSNPAVGGPINVTAPGPVTNREFARTLGRVLRRPAWLPVPAFALKIAFGAMSEIVLEGQRVLPERAGALGFEFQHPAIEGALRALYGASRSSPPS